MDTGGMPDDWKPSPQPPVGSKMWKRDMAVNWAIAYGLMHTNKVEALYRCPILDGHDLGYIAIARRSGGTDYIHSEGIEE